MAIYLEQVRSDDINIDVTLRLDERLNVSASGATMPCELVGSGGSKVSAEILNDKIFDVYWPDLC